ncbi:MAG: hypothetical protein NDI75_15015, partial [Candidatus Didemnitutus sp.]|nr:hypothetical protein [Candidatus Didemnitutus sp.]
WLLQGFAQRAQMLSKTIGYQLGDMKTLVNLVNLQATLVLQQPRSALINSFELVLSPLWKTKFSSVSLGIAKQNLLSAFGDTADALGLQGLADLARNSDMARRRLDYGVKDSDQYLTWKQKSADTDVRLAAPDRPESVTSRFFRTSNGLITKVRDFSNMGANDARDTLGLPVRTRETASAKFRPLGVFTTVSNVMNSALVDGVYSAMSDLALRGLRLIEAGGGEAMARQLESGALRLTHTDLGYNRRWLIFNDKAAFDYLADRVVSTMGENSLEQFVAKAWRRQQAAKGGPFEVIDGRQFMGVVTMALSELSLQANMVNTPLALMNSPLARVFSTFLIWPWNAMVRSAGVFRDARGRWTSEAALDGLTVVMMGVVPATLAASFVVDLYDEKVLGKRSNMRELPADAVLPGAALAHPMASLERLARYGAFGLASEAVNGVLNFDDARGGFSADNRIFILNQLNSFRYLIGNLYQQEGNFTYQSAGRPLLQFVGMNGPLQYLQLVSNQLGVENAETQVNARINSGNYLRAAGRALDLDVRVMRGPQSIPTPMTPYIQQMELAALTGDSAMFQSAYARAIQEASQEGKAEPVKYVQQAFADRHPLRRIFRTVPSQIEYRQMVGSMNESGRESVSRAVLAYNSYLQRLGLKPVTGRDEQKVAPAGARPMSLGEARAAAAAASYGYGP